MRMPNFSLEWHPGSRYAELHISDGSPIYPNGRWRMSFGNITKRDIHALIYDLQHELDKWKETLSE